MEKSAVIAVQKKWINKNKKKERKNIVGAKNDHVNLLLALLRPN